MSLSPATIKVYPIEDRNVVIWIVLSIIFSTVFINVFFVRRYLLLGRSAEKGGKERKTA